MPTATKVSLSEQVSKIPPATRPTVQAAIRMVKEAAPKAEEIVYRSSSPRSKTMMWKIVRYAAGGVNVVGIGTFANHSAMFFYRGRELQNEPQFGSGMLQGSGKDSRFITLRGPADAEQPVVKRLVRKAFQLAGAIES